MPSNTVADLLGTLRALRLLEPPVLEKLAALQARIPDPSALARKLVAQGQLTAYQAECLLKGQGKELLLDAYVILDRLGEGGMGEVFKARNRKMNRIVALKVIRKERLQNANAVRRFHREVQAASQLMHPNIALAFDAGQTGTTHFFAMEYIDGIDLTGLVKQKGPQPVARACDFIRQAALGLQHAHERGMVHRDIKPANLLLSRTDLVIKVLDMGLARVKDEDETLSVLTQEGSVLGTLDYLSPEQAMDAHKADIRSDLYSLGCTFYFLLTGQVPFPGGTATEKLLKHRLEEPTPVEKLRQEVPANVAKVVRRLMAKRPEDRYQTPAELVTDLTGKVGRLAAAAPPPDAGQTLADGADVTARHRRASGNARSKWPWVAAGALLVLLLGVGWLLSPKTGEPQGKPTSQGAAGTTPTRPVPPVARYVKKATREATIVGVLRSAGLPALDGKWHAIGYFDLDFKAGVDKPYPPENEIILSKSYPGKFQRSVSWKKFDFQVGQNVSLNTLMPDFLANLAAIAYLSHEIEVAEPLDLPLAIGGEDSVMAWLNGTRVFHHIGGGAFLPDPNPVTLRLKAGKNQLLIKSCNGLAKNTVYLCPQWPAKLEADFGENLKRDFPK